MAFLIQTKRMTFNCKKMDDEGVTKVVCEPIEIRGNVKQRLSERPVQFRLTENGYLDLIDDGGVPKDIIKELDEYLSFFRKT